MDTINKYSTWVARVERAKEYSSPSLWCSSCRMSQCWRSTYAPGIDHCRKPSTISPGQVDVGPFLGPIRTLRREARQSSHVGGASSRRHPSDQARKGVYLGGGLLKEDSARCANHHPARPPHRGGRCYVRGERHVEGEKSPKNDGTAMAECLAAIRTVRRGKYNMPHGLGSHAYLPIFEYK